MIAIALALFASVALAVGAMLQHSGIVEDHETPGTFGIRALLRLFRDRNWVIGLVVMGAGLACNIVALAIAPVMVVQPIGAVSLLVSILLGIRFRNLHLKRRVWGAVAACAGGVAVFVALSALIAQSGLHTGPRAHTLAWLGIGLSVLFLIVALVYRHAPQLLLVIAAGLQFGFVATNVHLVAVQFLHGGLGTITWLNVVALIVGSAVGTWSVQTSYAAGPPEIVIAGLTVIDPIVAVVLGALVLGEASRAPIWLITVMTIMGLMACVAVFVLAKYHPDTIAREQERKKRQATQSRAPQK